MGEVNSGDQLLGADGSPTTVVHAFDVVLGRPCYEVEFSDGTVIVADGSHRWLTHTRFTRRYAKAPAVHTTDEIAATLRCDTADRRLNHSVTNCAPLVLPKAELPLPPYTFGVWLGDGHSAAARFTTADPEIVAYVEADGLIVRPSGPRVYTILPEPLPEPPKRSCVVCGVRFRPRAARVKT